MPTNVNVMIPRVSMGGITLGDKIDSYLSREDCFHFKGYVLGAEEEWYEFDNGSLVVWLKDGFIDSISCEKNVFWQGMPIIGMNINTFVELFQLHIDTCDREYLYEVPDNKHAQYQYTFHEPLGIYVWTWRKRIVTVYITRDYQETE